MITGRQIRAARGLLGISQEELAQHIGLTKQGISKIEDGSVQPRNGTMTGIAHFFNDRGVEFTDNSGVRLKPQGMDILVGQEGLQQFFNGVYEHTKEHGGAIVQFGVDEDLFWAMGVEFSKLHRERMAALVKERRDIKVSAIICEGDTNFIASSYNEYRWIAKEFFAAVPFYIYGETLAIMNFETVPAPTIILHKFPAITNAYRKQFEAFWKMSREPDLAANQSQSPDKAPKKKVKTGKRA